MKELKEFCIIIVAVYFFISSAGVWVHEGFHKEHRARLDALEAYIEQPAKLEVTDETVAAFEAMEDTS